MERKTNDKPPFAYHTAAINPLPREKVLARMKVKPGPPLSAGVETDDQIWPLLKK